ncbi:hypothetical protein APA386B_2039 [Acetobacter pasteurianus 386B]|nr:hypothetical protein APA386B_2039 [Acetobacter pasteurianus 386B]
MRPGSRRITPDLASGFAVFWFAFVISLSDQTGNRSCRLFSIRWRCLPL